MNYMRLMLWTLLNWHEGECPGGVAVGVEAPESWGEWVIYLKARLLPAKEGAGYLRVRLLGDPESAPTRHVTLRFAVHG